MTESPTIAVVVQAGPIDIARETTALTAGLAEVGALVTFAGICRGEAGRLVALEIEHFPGMAEAEIRRIAKEAAARWNILGLSVVHRSGLVRVGETIVAIIAASSHRADASKAAEFLMDFLKTDAPFWKREIPASGGAVRWIEASAADGERAKRWGPVPPPDNPLIGAWRLLSWRNEAADGTITYPMGKDAVGFILYTADGAIAAHLGKADRPPFAGNDLVGGTPAEDAAAMKSYVSYSGSYEFHGDHVIHHVKIASFPNWTGTDQRRQCRFAGDTVLLSGDPFLFEGQTIVAHALWERVRKRGGGE